MDFDYYKVLGVTRSADSSAIKRAYRRKAKMCHPDRNPSPKAQRIFHVVQRAYETLSDPKTRKIYDDRLLFHRPWTPEDEQKKQRKEDIYRRARRMRRQRQSKEDALINPFLFYGIHVVGLVFGIIALGATLVGFVADDWEAHMVFFGLAGLAVIPDSLIGLFGKRSLLTKLASKMDRFITFEWGPEPLDRS